MPNILDYGGSDDKVSACNVGDPSSIPGLGRSSGEGNGNPLQYPLQYTPENPMDRRAWYATGWVTSLPINQYNLSITPYN